jgi:hypothetical protein
MDGVGGKLGRGYFDLIYIYILFWRWPLLAAFFYDTNISTVVV